VIEATAIAKRYGDRPIVRDFSIRIERGDRIGFVGPNGSGKTTLINLITGGLAPDQGTLKLGTSLAVATLDQRRESLDPETTVADTLTDGRGDSVIIAGKARHVLGYMKDFLFRPEQARTPVKALSGGERGRLMLARALARPSNLLVLDEPTNDLDLETLDLLQEMLSAYPGTLLLVSHDRDFLDRTVTATIAHAGTGHWTVYAGGYSDMLAQRGQAPERKSAPATAAVAERARPQPRPSEGRRKLTFSDQHALKTLPVQMEKLAAEITELKRTLADPDLYRRDASAFRRTTEALADAEVALATAEEEWLRIELRREEIGQA